MPNSSELADRCFGQEVINIVIKLKLEGQNENNKYRRQRLCAERGCGQ
jgi:hypothetical protein